MLSKISQYSQGNTCARVSFQAAILLKKRFWHKGFPVNFAGFIETFFTEEFWMTASYFTTVGNFQVVRSHQSGKKSSIHLKGFCYLVSYAKRMLYSAQPTISFAQRHLNIMIVTNFKNLNSIWNIFQEIHHFLVLTEGTSVIPPQSYLIWFGPNIKYLSERFFAEICCQEGISCLNLYEWLIW